MNSTFSIYRPAHSCGSEEMGETTSSSRSGDFDTKIRGPLTIFGGDGADTINLNDLTDGPAGDSYTFDRDGSTSTMEKPVRTMTFINVEEFVLDASPNYDTINIDGLLSSVNLPCQRGSRRRYDQHRQRGFRCQGPRVAVTINGGDQTVADTIHLDDTADERQDKIPTFDYAVQTSTMTSLYER